MQYTGVSSQFYLQSQNYDMLTLSKFCISQRQTQDRVSNKTNQLARGDAEDLASNTQTDIERCAVEGSAEIKMLLSGCFCLHVQLREILRCGRGYVLGLMDKDIT